MLQVFNSPAGQTIRVVEKDGEPWFIASDLCSALDLGNVSMALGRLDADEHTIISTEGIPGARNPQARLVSESGLYSLVLGSRKPEAKSFKRWVTHEVLPAIRKTGGYQVKQYSRKELLLMNLEAEERIEALTTQVHQLDEYAQEAEQFLDEVAEPAIAFQALLQAGTHDVGSHELALLLGLKYTEMLRRMRLSGIIFTHRFFPQTGFGQYFQAHISNGADKGGIMRSSTTWYFKLAHFEWLQARITTKWNAGR